jgi:hypothetical protein
MERAVYGLSLPTSSMGCFRRIPKGFRNKAQGCEERATLGNQIQDGFNPNGVAPSGTPKPQLRLGKQRVGYFERCRTSHAEAG